MVSTHRASLQQYMVVYQRKCQNTAGAKKSIKILGRFSMNRMRAERRNVKLVLTKIMLCILAEGRNPASM